MYKVDEVQRDRLKAFLRLNESVQVMLHSRDFNETEDC